MLYVLLVASAAIALTSADLIHTGQYPEADTIYGRVRGNRLLDEATGRIVDEFLGVPFAAPPVRFSRPQIPLPWEGVRDATAYSPHCIHFIAAFYPAIGYSNETSEDCLYLNIYVPGGVGSSGQLKPVMVWYYGGAYFLGTAAMYPGHELALHGDVIVVGFNYRLSSIGWATTGDAVMPGNYALWDAHQALVWVRDNIVLFGGDSNSVTIFGQSAGGAMTSHSLISPQLNGLIHRGIAVSGSSTGFFGVGERNNTAASTLELANWLLCRRADTSEEVRECLMEEDPNTLDFWAIVGVVTLRQQLPNWMPVVDGLYLPEDEAFVPRHPKEMWMSGAASNKDVITGHTHHDSSGFITGSLIGIPTNDTNRMGWAATPASTRFGLVFINNVYDNANESTDAIYEHQPLIGDEDDMTRILSLAQATTDWWFEAFASFEAGQHAVTSEATGKSTYLYDFRHDQSFIGHPEWVEASHMDDLYSIFGDPFFEIVRSDFLKADFDEGDLKVKDYVMSFYTNFARTGDPNNGPSQVPLTWPQYNPSTRQKLEYTETPRIITEDADMQERYQFWQEEYPTITLPKDPWNVGMGLSPYNGEAPSSPEEAVEIFLTHLWMNYEEVLEHNPDIWDNIQDIAQRELEKLAEKRRQYELDN